MVLGLLATCWVGNASCWVTHCWARVPQLPTRLRWRACWVLRAWLCCLHACRSEHGEDLERVQQILRLLAHKHLHS